jgi:uncharacterized protein (DUF1501 family)
MLTRRQLLERSLLLSLSPCVPTFLSRTAFAAAAERDRRILVVIQLDGGNDGLNTVVPFKDENYARLRPKLKLASDRLIKLKDDVYLNQALKPLAERFDGGRMCLVQGVGYPNPNRSHFESMAIWHAARLAEAEQGQYGWLGRALDVRAADEAGPHAIYASSNSVPVALWGRRSTTAVIRSAEELNLDASTELLQAATQPASDTSDLTQSISTICREAFTTCQRLAPVLAAEKSTSDENRLAASLATIAALIKADTPARVYYAAQSGYDTHSAQQYDHARLLRGLGRAVDTFLKEMQSSGLDDRVLVLAFSEFGRRAAENGSEGTDHGAAAPVFLAGPAMTAGILGPTPNLGDLEDGDVRTAIDFRRLYATLLDRWLEIPSGDVLQGAFEPLPIFG